MELSSATGKNVQDKHRGEMEEKLKKLEEIYSCLPPVLIRRVLTRDNVNGNVEIASRLLQEFLDFENPLDTFKNPAAAPLIGTGEGTNSRRRSLDDVEVGNTGGYQGNRGQHARQTRENPNRRDQGHRGRSRDSGNKGRGLGGMIRVQGLSNVETAGQSAVTGANVKEQSGFEGNQLLVCGLSASTTEDVVVNFIEAMSGEEVKEVTLRSNKALITMANDVAGN